MRKLNKGLALVAMMGMMVAVATGCGKTKVDLNKYVDITFSGYDHIGTATAEFDTEAFEKKYGKTISNIEFFEELVMGDLDKSTNLSNGDKVTYEWDLEQEFMGSYSDLKIVYKDIEKKVSGLKKADSFDPFANVIVTENDGWLRAYNGSEYEEMQISLSRTGVKPGETGKLLVEIEDIDAFVEKYGMIPNAMEKEFVVKEKMLDHYMSSSKEISDVFQKGLQNDGRRIVINDNQESEYKTTPKYLKNIGCEPVQTLFFKSDDGMLNRYFIIYKVSGDVVIDGMEYGKIEFFEYVYYNNLAVDKDGEQTCSNDVRYASTDLALEDMISVPSGVFSFFKPHYNGFLTLDEAVEKLTTWAAYGYTLVD